MERDWHLRISNPSSSHTVTFEITALAEPGAAYPLQHLPRSLPYAIPLVAAGVILAVIGATFSRRDISALLSLRGVRSFWTCFLVPATYILDAAITYASIRCHGVTIETNPVVASLYQTGMWAVLTFNLATITLVTGFSCFMYGLIVRTSLPKISKLVVAVLYSTIFGAMSLLVLLSSCSLVAFLLPYAFEYLSPTFFLVVGTPILLSSVLAAYLSTIIPEEDTRQSKHAKEPLQ